MGTAEFAVPTIQGLIDAGHEIVRVYTQPPRPAGRGRRPRRSAVHEAAARAGIAVATPATLKGPEAIRELAELAPHACVIAAYGQILPEALLEVPPLGCLNVHASLLPRWRGAAPIQRAILAGDAETGVTIIRMDAGIDTGPMLSWDRLPIAPTATAGALHDSLAELGAKLLVDALDELAGGRLTPTPQPGEGACYARKLQPEEGQLDWRRPASDLDRLWRGLSPAPGVYFVWETARIKVHVATVTDLGGPPGSLLANDFTVACGDEALRLDRVQRPGGARVGGAAYLRGARIPLGSVLPCPATS